MTVARGVVCVVGASLLCTLYLVRKLGQWTEELLKVDRSNRLVLKELKVFTDRRRASSDRAINHVAPFCYEDDDPPSTEASA